jgi:hypothetical protein
LYIAEIATTALHATSGYLSDSDFSATDSEYVPSDSDRASSSEDEGILDEDKTVEEPKHQPRRQLRLQAMEYVSLRINDSDKDMTV